jgi:hypothetical protein
LEAHENSCAIFGVTADTAFMIAARASKMPRTEDHISPTNIMRATGIGHHFSICRKGEKWLATYDGVAQAEGQTRMEAVVKLNQQLSRKL